MAIRIIFTDKNCITYKEVHFVGCILDYTLCGITLDGDEQTAGDFKATTKKVNCDHCKRIVQYCQNIKYTKECDGKN